ncbi:hypothetical protein GS454_04720 [Rhodococcus hoagii]|nr:hypothetical protein [Prescottella equi]
MPARDSQQYKVLSALIAKGTVTNVELSKICLRYSARIKDLRDQGFIIETEHVKGPVWSFTLVDQVQAAA